MLDKRDPRRRASQPLIVTPSTSSIQETLPRSSSFLAGLKAFRPKRTKNDTKSRRTGRRDSHTNPTRRVSADSSSSDDNGDNVVEVLSIPTKHGDKEFRWDNSGDDTDDAELSTGKISLRMWRRVASTTKPEASKATVMYSISFYPWKMEPRGYYSHPEAAANWVPDTASSRCQICLVAFTLTRRRHHCRLCGHLVCANCSHDRTYLPFAGAAPSQHRLIKDGAPQRTCSSCASTLRNMAGQDDPRVKRFTVAVSSARPRKSTVSALSTSSSRSVVEVEVERPSPWLRRTGMALTDSDIEDEEFFIESTKALQLDQRSRGTTHHFPLRLSVTRAEELDEILCARASSQVGTTVMKQGKTPDCRQFVLSSAWLDQWLKYVRVDSASTDAAASNSSDTELSDERRHRYGTRRHKSTAKCRMRRPPRPGPVTNYMLLDFVNGELVPKANLQRSRGSHAGGDYRIVSQEVWVAFLELYGGGPSIQVPLSNDATSENSADIQSRSPKRWGKLPQWIISELDDSLPALAASPPTVNYSSATKKAAARRRGNERKRKSIQPKTSGAVPRTRSAPGNCLISTASMPSIVKKTSGYISHCCESPRSSTPSEWEVMEGSSRTQETKLCVRTSEVVTIIESEALGTAGDSSSTLAAVSAFASAATLARQRSAASLSRHSSSKSSRTNGSMLENE